MNNTIDEMQLLRLYDCAVSTRCGAVDQGFPKTMQELASHGFVQKKDKGYVVTTEGLLYIKVNKDRLFGKPRRRKKDKKYEERDNDYSSEE
jgi:predicted transcriptional regulator